MSCTQYELLPILITALKKGNIVLGFSSNRYFLSLLFVVVLPLLGKLRHGSLPATTVSFFAGPSSTPTSEALRRSSRHSYFRPHPRLIPHRGPAPRGPQEERSDRWWAAIRRRHCTAAESVRWCWVMPVLIEHTQDTTYYAPYWWQGQLSNKQFLCVLAVQWLFYQQITGPNHTYNSWLWNYDWCWLHPIK